MEVVVLQTTQVAIAKVPITKMASAPGQTMEVVHVREQTTKMAVVTM